MPTRMRCLVLSPSAAPLQSRLHDKSDVSMKLLLNGILEILKIVCAFFNSLFVI